MTYAHVYNTIKKKIVQAKTRKVTQLKIGLGLRCNAGHYIFVLWFFSSSSFFLFFLAGATSSEFVK